MVTDENCIIEKLALLERRLSAERIGNLPNNSRLKSFIRTIIYFVALMVIFIFWSQSFHGSILFANMTVIVQIGDNIQDVVDANPDGTTFLLKTGVYRLQSIVPKTHNSFIGEQGTILCGANVLTYFEKQDPYWVATNHSEMIETNGICESDYPGCAFPEDLFVDDVPLRRVTKLEDMAPGKWYLDYNTDKIYLADNPTGHKVEISILRHAFYGSASNVTIRGIVIEKYANPAQTGAIHAMANPGPLSYDWVVEDNEIRLNHGGAITPGHGMQILGNKIHHNGQIGVTGTGRNVLVENNEIAYNNYAGYSFNWEAGGTKFSFSENLVVRNNFVHHNNGPGLWTDCDNYNVLYELNRTTANKLAGILHEISFDATIRRNIVYNDGLINTGKSAWHGSGISILASSNVEVYENEVFNCKNGIIALQTDRGSSKRNGRAYIVENLFVHNNTITQITGFAAGICRSEDFDNSIFLDWNNRYQDNTYRLADLKAEYYVWMGSLHNRDQWHTFNNDINGIWLLYNETLISMPKGFKILNILNTD